MAPDLRNGRVDIWDDRCIEAGADWAREIETAIARARVVVLLVTPGFLNSEFIMERELPLILDAQRDGLTILWIPVYGTFYGDEAPPALEPIARLQAVCPASTPLVGQPLSRSRRPCSVFAGQ